MTSIRVNLTFFDLELESDGQRTREFILPDTNEPFEDVVAQLDAEAQKGMFEETGAILVEMPLAGQPAKQALVQSDEMLLDVVRHRMKGHPR